MTALFVDYIKFTQELLPNYWQEEATDPTTQFNLYKILTPFFSYMYYREQGIVCDAVDANGNNYGIGNMSPTVIAIANGTFPDLPIPPWPSALFSQTQYQLAILEFIGNIVNLPLFQLSIPICFTLSDPIRGILSGDSYTSTYPLGGGLSTAYTMQTITPQEYANCLLARCLKFYGCPSTNAILQTVAYAAQTNISNISFEISGLNVIITINSIPEDYLQKVEAFMAFRDNYGEPLYIEPSYGEIEFVFNYV